MSWQKPASNVWLPASPKLTGHLVVVREKDAGTKVLIACNVCASKRSCSRKHAECALPACCRGQPTYPPMVAASHQAQARHATPMPSHSFLQASAESVCSAPIGVMASSSVPCSEVTWAVLQWHVSARQCAGRLSAAAEHRRSLAAKARAAAPTVMMRSCPALAWWDAPVAFHLQRADGRTAAALGFHTQRAEQVLKRAAGGVVGKTAVATSGALAPRLAAGGQWRPRRRPPGRQGSRGALRGVVLWERSCLE